MEFLIESVSYADLFLYIGTDPRQFIVAELYSLYGCMLIEDLFIQARPMLPYIFHVVINVRAKIRKKYILIQVLQGCKLYCCCFRSW